MTSFLLLRRSLYSSVLALGLTTLVTKTVNAAIVTYDFTISPDSGVLLGNTYNGNLSYNDSSLTGANLESTGLTSFFLPFQGNTYTLTTNPTASADFSLNSFIGANFAASNATLTSGAFTLDINSAFFAYDLGGVGNSGTGTIAYTKQSTNTTAVPEGQPITALGTIVTLGLAAALKRKTV